jgi:hypothetical protein
MIHMTHIELFSALLLAIALVLFLRYNLSISRELSRTRRETSRFPLFAARGRLVRLVAEGRIDERDPAWQNLYAQVNFLLRMDQRLDLPDLVSRYMTSQLEVDRDPRLRERIDEQLKRTRETAARVPEFGEVVEETLDALIHLVRRRSTRLHRAALLSLSIFFRILSVALRGGVSSARVVRQAVEHPSSDNLLKWQAIDEDCHPA